MPIDFQSIVFPILQNAFAELQKCERWCDVDNHDPADNEPYNHTNYRNFYILKYFPAYFIEYYKIYESMSAKINLDDKTILSIGCGSAIDYYALTYLLQHNNFKYIGIDIFDWEYRPATDRVEFFNNGIEAITKEQIQAADIIIFPKSIANMSEYIQSFAEKLLTSAKKDFFVVYSMATHNETKFAHGIAEKDIINDTLLTKYTCTDIFSYYKPREEDPIGLKTIHHPFLYPQDIINALNRFETVCPSAESEVECTECSCRSMPILKDRYFCYSYMRYTIRS